MNLEIKTFSFSNSRNSDKINIIKSRGIELDIGIRADSRGIRSEGKISQGLEEAIFLNYQ